MMINEFYRDKSILITGATGFIGKVLCEKFLRSCPDIRNIYVILRSRNGKSPKDRLNDELFESKAFALNNNKFEFDKIIAVNGDISEPGLGLSQEDRDSIITNVSIVFHSAASVKFHGPIKDFMALNVFGTESVMQLCRQLSKLEALVYVSTAYSNCNLREVEEKVYPLILNARNTIDKVNCVESLTANASLMDEILEGRPNAYTFSKALAENLVHENYSDLPVVIVRPSIVTPALHEPVPGWVDNLNGVAGALLLGSLGIARTMEVKCDITSDLIPVDIICNSLIVIGWHTATNVKERKKVIHLTSGQHNPISWGQFLNHSREAALNAPSIKIVRPLAKNPTSAKGLLGRVNHLFTKYISHLFFAYFIDFILALLGYKTLMVKVTHKMHRAFTVLEHFTNKEWHFHNDNYYLIYDSLTNEEKESFFSDTRKLDWREYAKTFYMGTRRYLLKEDDSNIEKARKRFLLIRVFYFLFQLTLLALIWYTFIYPIVLQTSHLLVNVSSNSTTVNTIQYNLIHGNPISTAI